MSVLGRPGVRDLSDVPHILKSVAIAPIPDKAVEHGEIFTRPWIVDLILDLEGYTADRDLAAMRAVEPACGTGAFLGPMVERLSASLRTHNRTLDDAADAIRAYDLLPRNVQASRALVVDVLTTDGWDQAEAVNLADKLISEGDYLLRDREDGSADFVVGNPPYIRLEGVPDERSDAYRAACPTMGGRADIYVGFLEVGLLALKPGGTLGYIVADRWMRNQYGSRLREFVADGHSVDVTISMHDVDAFEEQVSAYPAISIIRRGKQGKAIVADTTRRFGPADADALLAWTRKRGPKPITNDRFEVARLPHWFGGGDLWPTGSPAILAMIEDLNDRFHPLEDPSTGTRVSIGVATGADGVYVTKNKDAAEPERMLPLSMAADTNSGTLTWSGHYLVNPWEGDSVVELEDWPKLAAYFEANMAALRRRNVANKNPKRWYRTIDKVTASLTDRPKLLFPDMRMTSRPVYDPGGLYPHHNLYHVVSDVWDLRVLGGLLFSRVAEATVEAYCVKMRGGTLRFQAQYLRRIRVPRPEDISPQDAAALAQAFDNRDADAATVAALRVYGLGDAPWLKPRAITGYPPSPPDFQRLPD
jgi:hypothetical protein